MTLPLWPSSLPHEPVGGSWSVEALHITPLSTDMDGGNTRQRRRPGSDVSLVNQTLRMTRSQLATFKSFMRDTLFNGVSRFMFTVWMGDGCEERECQFAAQPTIAASGSKVFFVSMQLRVYGGLIPPFRLSGAFAMAGASAPAFIGSSTRTVLLLHGDGPPASTVIADSSGLGHTLTRGSGAQIDSSQSKFGGSSILFNGVSNSLLHVNGTSPDLAFGLGDFTIHFHARWADLNLHQILVEFRLNGGDPDMLLYKPSTGGIILASNNNTLINSGISLTTAGFYHFAITRASLTSRLFIDGISQGSAADPLNYGISPNRPAFGVDPTLTGFFFNGWMDEIEIIKGRALWTANFTPPAAPAGTLSPQVLLLHGDGPDGSTAIFDSSLAARRVVPGGGTEIDTSQSVFGGGSIVCSGGNGFSFFSNGVDFNFPAGTDFTIDFRFRLAAAVAGSQILFYSQATGPTLYSMELASGILNGTGLVGTTVVASNTTYHFAMTRAGTNTRMFLNGVQEGATKTGDVTNYTHNSFQFGVWQGGGGNFIGWFEEVRILKGIAAWTANFTPPAAPYT